MGDVRYPRAQNMAPAQAGCIWLLRVVGKAPVPGMAQSRKAGPRHEPENTAAARENHIWPTSARRQRDAAQEAPRSEVGGATL